jgi:hypothetical protein
MFKMFIGLATITLTATSVTPPGPSLQTLIGFVGKSAESAMEAYTR